MARPAWMELPKPSKPWHWAWVFTIVTVALAWLARPDPQHLIFHNTSDADLLLQHTPANWKDLALVTPMAQAMCKDVTLVFAHQFNVSDRRLRDKAFYFCSEGWMAAPEVVNKSGKIFCKEEYGHVIKTTKRFKNVNVTYLRDGYPQKSSFSSVQSCEVQFAIAVLDGRW